VESDPHSAPPDSGGVLDGGLEAGPADSGAGDALVRDSALDTREDTSAEAESSGSIVFTEYDYASNAVESPFTVQ
jgi:hypothetical protein